jgi:hypothetical protein
MAGPQHGTRARGHTNRAALRSALWPPILDELADPVVVAARLAAEAEEAGWDGFCVWDHSVEVAATIAGLRRHSTAPYDIAVGLPPGTDPAPYAKVGATWWMTDFAPEAVSLDEVRGVLRDGPAAA